MFSLFNYDLLQEMNKELDSNTKTNYQTPYYPYVEKNLTNDQKHLYYNQPDFLWSVFSHVSSEDKTSTLGDEISFKVSDWLTIDEVVNNNYDNILVPEL